MLGDRVWDSQPHRRALWHRGIAPLLACRHRQHGSNLGVYRRVVERVFAWLRCSRVRYECRPDIRAPLVPSGCILICWNFLSKSL